MNLFENSKHAFEKKKNGIDIRAAYVRLYHFDISKHKTIKTNKGDYQIPFVAN
jgi:hypothetical protein